MFSSNPPPSEPSSQRTPRTPRSGSPNAPNPKHAGPGRPMTIFLATAWALGAFYVLQIAGLLLISAPERPSALAVGVGCQAFAYLLALFLILRVHAPDASIRAFLGLRATHPAFLVLGALLGAAMVIPHDALFTLIIRRFPTATAEDMLAGFDALSLAQRATILAAITCLAPICEEVLFRGALYGPLRRAYPDARIAVVVTGVLFAIAHVHWQWQAVIVILGMILGYLRWASGSLFPTILFHIAFNSSILWPDLSPQVPAGSPPAFVPVRLLLGSSAVALALLGLVHLASKSDRAVRARELDLERR